MSNRRVSRECKPISRRRFLGATASAAGGGLLLSQFGCGGGETSGDNPPRAGSRETVRVEIEQSGWGRQQWAGVLDTILEGFLRNALRTSDTFAVCDYAGGTILDNFLSVRGQTCDSVSRILPALAAVIAGPDSDKALSVDAETYDLREVFLSALRHGTDPASRDFWGYASPTDWDQRQVESSIVAFSLWLVRDRLMDEFSAGERRNIQQWLKNCTRVNVRRNNWALFTAVNHAVRMALGERWEEFHGDEDWFRDDLAAIESMYSGSGWYTDTTSGDQYDYYNFWVFASHNLYWDMVIGDRFPQLRSRFRARLGDFLRTTPYLFGGNGSHVMWGRSLIYRWGTLTPLVLGHGLGLWPYSTGLLRRICNRNLAFLWEAGAWDRENHKLRETMTPHSSTSIKESYINNGHPYWGMQAFFAASLGDDDSFWSAPEEALPVEQGDFRYLIEGPDILVAGHRDSGQVQIWQSDCDKSAGYRSKYYNFSYSSHFSFNVELAGGLMAPDCTLSFSDSAGNYARRDTPFTGAVRSDDGVQWQWSAVLGEEKIEVESMMLIDGEIQWRAHRVGYGGKARIIAAEHTYTLGLAPDETPEARSGGDWEWGRSPLSGCTVFIRSALGFSSHEPLAGFRGRDDLCSIHARGRQASVTADLEPNPVSVLIAAVYASPAPVELDELVRITSDIPSRVAAWAGIET
ncbi:MAG: DUF2264 domain-containing protein [Candidatus Glassbacteria bacterium]|nr:DUF2264 domain-containing protein [Candidatus Glassbacteria bacterium]